MQMTDCVKVRKRDGSREYMLQGVCFTETMAISKEQAGFYNGGQAVLRIPEQKVADLACGDRVSLQGESRVFVVTELRDNRKKGSALSHWKAILRG